MRTIERAAYTIGALLIMSGLAHAAILLATGGSWSGPLSLRKPAAFGLSFGLTLINVTLIASLMPLSHRMQTRLIGVFAAACVIETWRRSSALDDHPKLESSAVGPYTEGTFDPSSRRYTVICPR
jgi:hypothetical protein